MKLTIEKITVSPRARKLKNVYSKEIAQALKSYVYHGEIIPDPEGKGRICMKIYDLIWSDDDTR